MLTLAENIAQKRNEFEKLTSYNERVITNVL